MPKILAKTNRTQSRRAASKEAMKQMHMLLDNEQRYEISSDDDVIEVDFQPPRKKHKSTTKSSESTVVTIAPVVKNAVKKSTSQPTVKKLVDSIFELDVQIEELSPAQKARKNQMNKEDREMEVKLEQIVKDNRADVIYKGVLTTAVEVTEELKKMLNSAVTGGVVQFGNDASHKSSLGTLVPQAAQGQSIVIPPGPGGTLPQSYQLVMDPKSGVIIGAVSTTPNPGASGVNPPPLQIYQSKGQTTVASPADAPKTRRSAANKQLLNKANAQAGTPLKQPVVVKGPVTTPQGRPILRTIVGGKGQQTTTTTTTTTTPQLPGKLGPGRGRNATTLIQHSNVKPTESSVEGGLTLGVKQSAKTIDLTSGEARGGPDSREVSFNKLQGRTYPSLVVLARPHLRVNDLTEDRNKLDVKVKSVLMHSPAKFTEWLIQQGLVRSEQKCSIHAGNALKLGMYSDASRFPYSGGYVWISECCPNRFVSIFSGSLFEGSQHPPMTILKLLYHWSCQTITQNITQWVKVDNLYVKNMYTMLRGVCTTAIHTHVKPLGGPGVRVQVGVISLGTTSHDGNKKEVKVEVLGVLESVSKHIRLTAVEPLPDGEKNYRKRFSKILEPVFNWVHPSSVILTDLTVDKATLHQMGFLHVQQNASNDYNTSNRTIMEYLRRIVPRMFQNTLSLLSRPIIQQFLDELVWREWYGTTVHTAFDNIVAHLSEQTRLDNGQNLITRLNKVAANPFKKWSLNASGPVVKQLNPPTEPGGRKYVGRGRKAPISNYSAPAPIPSKVQSTPQPSPSQEPEPVPRRRKKIRLKSCFVPTCKVTSKNSPGIIFLTVPKEDEQRREWETAAGCLEPLNETTLFCCEHHFNLREDTENWRSYKIRVRDECRLILKEGVVPRYKIHTPPSSPNRAVSQLSPGIKMLRSEIVSSVETLETESNVLGDGPKKEIEARIEQPAPKKRRKKSSFFKSCFVPTCKATNLNSPDIIFLTVPREDDRRFEWQEAAGSLVPFSKSSLYCCEHHFNLSEDAENWTSYKLMGGNQRRLILKKGVVPHCQINTPPTSPDRRVSQLSPSSKMLRSQIMSSLETDSNLEESLSRPSKSTSPDVPEQMVPLENYYYGTVQGAQHTPKISVNFNLKCPFCKATLQTNISLMNHLFRHAHNVASTDAQLCKYCLTIVPTAADLVCHVAGSHPDETKFDNGFVCLICETRFKNPFILGKHMSREHCPSELPYMCGTCNFRCSNHKQAVDHFYQQHDNGTTMQCPFCLKSTSCYSGGKNLTQNLNHFVQHLQKHQRKHMVKKCNRCTLWFIQKEFLRDHQNKMHSSQRGKYGMVPCFAPRNSVLVPKSRTDKFPEAKVINFATLQFNVNKDLDCKECGKGLKGGRHFAKFEECSYTNCHYATCCSVAMESHAAQCKGSSTVFATPTDRMPRPMHCICGFESDQGSLLAKHLVVCERKSAYSSTASAAKASVTKSMLDFLGLVRKPEETPKPRTVKKKTVEEEEEGEGEGQRSIKDEVVTEDNALLVEEDAVAVVSDDNDKENEDTSEKAGEDVEEEKDNVGEDLEPPAEKPREDEDIEDVASKDKEPEVEEVASSVDDKEPSVQDKDTEETESTKDEEKAESAIEVTKEVEDDVEPIADDLIQSSETVADDKEDAEEVTTNGEVSPSAQVTEPEEVAAPSSEPLGKIDMSEDLDDDVNFSKEIGQIVDSLVNENVAGIADDICPMDLV